MVQFIKKYWHVVGVLVVFLALLLRDPFSQRTLIPNFEPYPDTIHYVNSARSFLDGNGLQIVREGRAVKTTVPPMYSIVLMPLFFLNSDPRVFFFTNVILALCSFILFYKILSKIVDQKKLIGQLTVFVTLFLYVTNYFMYWYPSLAMAENLTLTLFMLSVYLLLLPGRLRYLIAAGLTGIAIYMTKYASLPLMAFFLLAYLIKILFEAKVDNTFKLKKVGIFILVSVITFLLYSWWEWGAKGSTLLATLFNTFQPQKPGTSTLTTGGWFSTAYMNKYLPEYLRAMAGGVRLRFLWDDTPILPIYVGVPALVGLMFGIIVRKTRLLTVSLVAMLFSSIVFMSTFYSQDMRYLYHAIPTLLIGFTLFWKNLFDFLDTIFTPKRNTKKTGHIMPLIGTTLLISLFLYYALTNAMRLKSAIMVNLKYAETPWYYISVLELNKYFAKEPPGNRKFPVVISSLIPYYIDFFSNGNYSLLPLSLHQEFRNSRKEAWGDYNYTNLIDLYHRILYRGYPLYVHNYGLGNEKVLHEDFKKIQEEFKLELVQRGCFDACNIWRVTEKYPIIFFEKGKKK